MATHEGSLCNGVFSDDFAHFEQNHDAYPVEAQAVFKSIAELRITLGAFRSATENICVADEAVASVRLLLAELEEPKPDALAAPEEAVVVDETAALMATASLNPPKPEEGAL